MNRRRLIAIFIGALLVIAACLVVYFIRGANWLQTDAPTSGLATNESAALAEAYFRLESASLAPLELTHDDNYPRGVMGDFPAQGRTLVEKARNYLEAHSTFYRQDDPNLGLEVLRTTNTSAVFYQTYKGVRVYASEMVVMFDGESIVATIGRLLPSGVEVETRPGLTPEDTLKPAAFELGLAEYTIRGNPRLVIFDPGVAGVEGEQSVLAWQILIENDGPLELILQASDGEILRQIERLEGHTGPYDLKLWDALNTNSSASNCYSINSIGGGGQLLGNEAGLFPNFQSDPGAMAAWQISQMNWLYYHGNYGLHSYDDLGGTVWAYIRSNTLGTASYSSDCNLMQFNEGAVVPDIYAHEFSHWVDEFHGDLIYQDESGALDESFADINGAMFDGNWLVAESAPDGPFRSMSNPNAYNSPDHENEFYGPGQCPSFGKDHGCVHYNSGIPNYVAYLLSEGGTHPDSGLPVESIGTGPVGVLHFLVMTTGLPSNAVFMDARNAAISIAESNWGLQIACKVQNAWTAVGYGQPDYDCDGLGDPFDDDDNDGVRETRDNCDDVYNPDQIDHDGDGIGAACDPDDNLGNPFLLCPTPGVECDTEDWDADGILNPDDNCIFTPNPDQADVDNDGEGDACDPDSDGDGISDNDDNCINTANPDQANADGDFAGDICDPTPNCDDVYAWSASQAIPVGDEIIQTEPQPIANPMACLPDMIMDGVDWLEEQPEINPDGEWHRVEVVRQEDPRTAIPLPVCGPETAGGSPSNHIQLIQLEDSTIQHIIAVNEIEEAKDELKDALEGTSDGAELTFIPRGGESYYLLLDLGNLSPDEGASLSFRLDCLPREPDEPVSQPEEGGSILRPAITVEPTASPTARLSPTPAPTDTAQVTPSDTPRPLPTSPPTSTPRPSPRPTDTPQRGLPTATSGSRGS